EWLLSVTRMGNELSLIGIQLVSRQAPVTIGKALRTRGSPHLPHNERALYHIRRITSTGASLAQANGPTTATVRSHRSSTHCELRTCQVSAVRDLVNQHNQPSG